VRFFCENEALFRDFENKKHENKIYPLPSSFSENVTLNEDIFFGLEPKLKDTSEINVEYEYVHGIQLRNCENVNSNNLIHQS